MGHRYRGAALPRHAVGVLGDQLRPPPPGPDRGRRGAARPDHADQPGVPQRPARPLLRRPRAAVAPRRRAADEHRRRGRRDRASRSPASGATSARASRRTRPRSSCAPATSTAGPPRSSRSPTTPSRTITTAPTRRDSSRVPYGDIDALAAAITERTVAFLVEPIQGEAGVVLPPTGFLQAARALCAARGVLFVADEIQSGLGRAGRDVRLRPGRRAARRPHPGQGARRRDPAGVGRHRRLGRARRHPAGPARQHVRRQPARGGRRHRRGRAARGRASCRSGRSGWASTRWRPCAAPRCRASRRSAAAGCGGRSSSTAPDAPAARSAWSCWRGGSSPRTPTPGRSASPPRSWCPRPTSTTPWPPSSTS